MNLYNRTIQNEDERRTKRIAENPMEKTDEWVAV